MGTPASASPRGLSRRRALQMLAASGGAVAGGSLIVSRPAVADSGSEACRFDFSGTPTASFTATSSIFGDFIDIELTGVGGTCPCGGAATTLYSFAIAAPNATLATGGWIASSSAGANFVDLWPSSGGPFTMSAGVQVTCAGGTSPTTVRCRFASAGYNMPGGAFEQVIASFGLPTNNGNSTLPNLPACTNIAAASVQSRSRSGGGLSPGAGQPPADLEARARAAAEMNDLGVPEAAPAEPAASNGSTNQPPTPPTTTSPPSTTTTAPTTSTSSTTTSLPTTTTSAPSTTTASTTSAPPPTTTSPPTVNGP